MSFKDKVAAVVKATDNEAIMADRELDPECQCHLSGDEPQCSVPCEYIDYSDGEY